MSEKEKSGHCWVVRSRFEGKSSVLHEFFPSMALEGRKGQGVPVQPVSIRLGSRSQNVMDARNRRDCMQNLTPASDRRPQ